MKVIVTVIALIWGFVLPVLAQAIQQPDVVELENKLKTASLKTKLQLINRFSQENLERHPGLSLQYARESLRLAEEGGDPADIATAIKNIGNWFYVSTQYKDALDYYLKALDYESKLENKRFIANVLTNIGMVYFRIGQYAKAEEYHRRAMEMRKRTGYTDREMGTTLNNLGMALHEQNRLDEAMMCYREAAALFNQGGLKRQVAAAYNNMGELYYKLKKYSLALGNYDIALKTYEKIDHLWGIANCKKNIGDVYYSQNDLDRAQKYFEISLALAEKGNFSYTLSDIYIGLSNLYKTRGDLKKALEFHERYVAIRNKLNEEEKNKLMTVLQVSFSDRQKDDRIRLLLQRQKNERLVIYTLVIVVVLILIVMVVLFSRTREHRRLELERVRAAKLETVSLLAGGIAHDFNNLLAIMVGNLEMAIMETEPGAGIRRYLEHAEKAAGSATTLAKKFLTISDKGFGFQEDVKIADFVRDTVRFTVDKTGIPVDLRLQIPMDLGIVVGDAFQLKRAVENLIQNSLESLVANGKGESDGKLEVNADVLQLENDVVSSLGAGAYAVFTFKDNGEGILPENLPRIFDPYFSTREDVTRKGLGMGLAVAQAVVKRHGGTITVVSHPGQGSVFSVYLPVSGSRH